MSGRLHYVEQHAASRPGTTWALLRLVLGFAQMGGAVVSLVLLLTLGTHLWTLIAAFSTTALTALSVFLFRRGSP